MTGSSWEQQPASLPANTLRCTNLSWRNQTLVSWEQYLPSHIESHPGWLVRGDDPSGCRICPADVVFVHFGDGLQYFQQRVANCSLLKEFLKDIYIYFFKKAEYLARCYLVLICDLITPVSLQWYVTLGARLILRQRRWDVQSPWKNNPL